MAKTVKIKTADEYNYDLTSSTKDTTYVFASESVAQGSVLRFSASPSYDNMIYARQGDDLYIYAHFGDFPKYKSPLTMIKDYYKYCEDNNGLVEVNDYSIYSLAQNEARDYITAKSFTDVEDGGYYLSGYGGTTFNISNTKTAKTKITDIGGKDKYIVNDLMPTSSYVYLEDMAGNDSYSITESRGVFLEDYTGNDKYVVKDCDQVIGVSGSSEEERIGDLYILDYSGNDTYIYDNVKSITEHQVYLYDESGNDKYTINDVYNFYVDDYTGNDKYTFTNSEDLEFEDESGNDVYKITDTDSLYIYDEEENYYYGVKGNDKYTITDCSNVEIDDEYGKDTYIMKNITGYLDIDDDEGYENDKYVITNAENVTICDEGGKETYNLTGVNKAEISDYYGYGPEPDKYTVKNSNDVYISDSRGNDSYSFSNTSKIEISDNGGADTYTIKGSYDKKTKTINYAEGVVIDDNPSGTSNPKDDNDKYNLTYVKNISASDWTIDDANGENTYNIKLSEGIRIRSGNEQKDTYNITSSKNVYISDEGYSPEASDVYSVKLANQGGVVISDIGGDADKLTISNLNKNNLVFMTNFDTRNENALDANQSLILFDTKTGGFVQIYDMFTYSGTDYSTTEFDDGLIETVKAGKKSIDVTNSDMIGNLNSLRETIAGFLGENTSVVDVLNSGDQEQIDALVLAFINA